MASRESYDYLRSREAYDYPRSRRHDSSKTSRRRHDSRLDPDDHDFTYERSLYPPMPDRKRSRAPKSREQSRAARRWPPPASVEDEKDSLAREFNPEVIDYDRVPARGVAEQEPILVDVPDHIPDRRFVWVASENHPTPPTSDDERAKRRGRRKAPKLETAGLPEMQREASPYAWSKPPLPSKPQAGGRMSAEFYLSPDAMTPPATSYSTPAKQPPTTTPHPDWAEIDRRAQKNASNDTASNPPASQQFYEGLGTTDTVHGADDFTARRAPSRYSWTKPETVRHSSYSSPNSPYSAPTHAPEELKRRPGSSEGLPSDHVRRPAPPMVTTLQQSEKSSARSRHRSDSSHSSRDYSSPLPQSPKSSSDRLRDSLPPSMPSSRPTSRGGSNQTSPQPSPRISHPAEYPWGSAFPSVSSRRPQPPSRLASSTSTYPTSPLPQSSNYHTPVHTPLPYPDHDRTYQSMPSERDHQYFPEQRNGHHPPYSEPVSHAGTSKRSSLSTRTTTIDELPATAGAPRSSTRPTSSDGQKAKVKAKVATPAPGPAPTLAPLPMCPRAEYSTEHTDWFTLESFPNCDICPHCVGAIFDGTPYRAFFKTSPPRPYNMAIRCEFSDPWIRLAWLLTLQRRIPNLSLLTSLANISETEEPCPGECKGVRNWHSVRDRDGHFLRGFVICPQDVKRLEVLLPGFRSLFVPLTTRMSYTDDYDLWRRCSIQPVQNTRYAVYIDRLILIHEAAVSAHRLPNPDDFISLVREKTSVPECSRDDVVRGASWYYIPSLTPAMTVCADCFNEIVVPHLQSDSDVVMRFNRSPQTVRNEGRWGSSCQLYSSRMRRIFRRAVEDNDIKYLTRRAKDRKEVEDGLQERSTEIKRLREPLKGPSGYAVSTRAQQELDRYDDELESLAEEWKKWE